MDEQLSYDDLLFEEHGRSPNEIPFAFEYPLNEEFLSCPPVEGYKLELTLLKTLRATSYMNER